MKAWSTGAILAAALLTASAPADDTAPDLKKAFERCAKISDDIAEIRQLDFTNRVQVKVQTKQEFIEYIDKEINEQYGSGEEIDNYIDALVLLGSLKEKVDFGNTLKEIMISQAAAHYDPRNDIYYLLMSDSPAFLLDVISSHELCHALQDQHFDLTNLIMGDPAAMRDNGDAAMAKQCVTEGDATIVMMWWAMAQQMPEARPAQLSAQVSLGVGMQASMDFDTMKTLMQQGVTGAGSSFGSIAGSVEDLDKFPRYFMESLLVAYIQGAVAVDRIRTQGGWKAVNELFSNPPASTEQILHPEKLTGERDDPTDIRLKKLPDALPEGWKLLEEDVLGELGIRILFATWQEPSKKPDISPSIAARGWDGDRYYYMRHEKDELLVWKSIWDSEKDAQEFTSALRQNLKIRYPDIKAGKAEVMTTDDRKIILHRKDREVLLINSPKSFPAEKLRKHAMQ